MIDRKRPDSRPGFTLIELLAVLLIIAVLAALLLGALGQARKSIRKTTTANDISQLELSITQFKTDYGFYPPSHISDVNGSGNPIIRRFRMPHRVDTPDFALLRKMYPRWQPGSAQCPVLSDGVTIDLNTLQASHPDYVALVRLTNPAAQGASTNPPATPLDSNQLLTLLLGGPKNMLEAPALDTLGMPNLNTSNINDASNGLGTGWDTAGPFAPRVTATSKKGPYFNYKQDQMIVQLTSDVFANSRSVLVSALPQFCDSWGTPYAYFAASVGDTYDLRGRFPWSNDSLANNDGAPDTYNVTAFRLPGSPDPNSPDVFTVHPYRSSNGKWMNPGKFQIISAGPDKMFGPGSVRVPGANPPAVIDTWDPTGSNPKAQGLGGEFYTGGSQTSGSGRGEDDLSNFNGGSALGTSNAP